MGVLDEINKGFGAVGGVLKKGYDAFQGEGPPPGVAGPATAGQPVVYDPGTGLYVNTATGAVSTDPGGQKVVQDPSLATQAARNLATSGQFLSSLGQYGQQYDAAQKAETSLAGRLNQTIAGTAPSAAQAQLESGLSQIVQQQQAAASGATGAGGALARSDAMRNAGNAEAATNAAQAGVRAQEVTGAEQALGGLLNNQAGQAIQQTGQGETAAGNFANLSGGEQGNQESLTQSGGKNQLTTLGTIASAGGQALGVGSDEDMKKDIKPADMHDFMGKLSAVSYDYKDPTEPGTTPNHVEAGITAQDAKKSKVGKKMVKGRDGNLYLDGVQAISAALAGLGDLHERVKKLESKRAA